MLFSKSLTYILTAPWPSQLRDWYCWAVLLAFVATAGFWIQRTAEALRRFPAGLVMSVMQVRLLLLVGCSSASAASPPPTSHHFSLAHPRARSVGKGLIMQHSKATKPCRIGEQTD